MDNHAQTNRQVFATQFPVVDQEPPRPTYPPPYLMVPQQQNASDSGKCKNILAGRISTIWLGSLLLVFGAMSQAGAAVAIRYSAGLSEIGAGLWCGYLFMAGGAVGIAVGHHGTKSLIIGTIVASALTIVASITQLAIAATGLTSDMDFYSCYPPCDPHTPWQHCPCYFDDWESSAIAANCSIVAAAALASIAGLWLLVVACIAIRKNSASFQDVSVPAQEVANAAQPNLYENIPHQPVFQVPVQLILSTTQPNVSEEIRNQQMHSMPVHYVLQQQYQQQMPLNHLQPSAIASSTVPSQGQDNQAVTQADHDDVVTALEL